MSFVLVPKSVTLNDSVPRISVFVHAFGSGATIAVSYFSNSIEGSPLTLVFGDIKVINIFARDHP